MKPPSAIDHPRAAFAHRDFRMFLLARITNNFGTNIMLPALSWQIYALTRDPLALGLIGLAVFIPVILSSLPSGQTADRLERRQVYRASQLLLILSALSFWALTLAGVTSPFYFYFGAALFGVAKTFSLPAATAWMPHLVPREHFPNAVAWHSSAFQITNIAGPALAGMMLYAFGEAATYMLVAACYLASLLFSTLVHTRSRGADTQPKGLAHLFTGFSYIGRNKLILGATTLDLFAVFFGGVTAMLPVFAFEILHVGEAGFGLLRSAPATGALATALLLAHRPLRNHVGRWLFCSVIVYGATIILFGSSRVLLLSIIALIILGAADMTGAFIRQTLVQLSTHDDMRGRVSSVNMIFGGARNELGNVQSGLMASLIGVVPAVMLGGACTLAVVGLWAWLFPALRRADRFDDANPEPRLPAKEASFAVPARAEKVLEAEG